MAKYRKKPVVIEAVHACVLLLAARNDFWALPKWVIAAYDKGDIIFARDGIHIKTLEGDHLGLPSDMIIQGVKGEIYPCKRDIFAATYELVEANDADGAVQ